MNPQTTAPIDTVGEFLAHALELEHESAQRYRELAQSLRVHHNVEIAELFERLARLSEDHARSVAARARAVRLPEIAPWDFKWDCPGCPEDPHPEGEVSYLMTTVQTLTLALETESCGRDFYACVAAHSPHPEVRRLAAEMAEEESGHVELIAGWLERERLNAAPPLEDLDPPNMPE